MKIWANCRKEYRQKLTWQQSKTIISILASFMALYLITAGVFACTSSPASTSQIVENSSRIRLTPESQQGELTMTTQQLVLSPVASETGTVFTTAYPQSGLIAAGDYDYDTSLRAFFSFDISNLIHLNVTHATLNIPQPTVYNQPTFGQLWVDNVTYGSLYNSNNFNCTGTRLGSLYMYQGTIDVTPTMQQLATAGKSRFQVRIYFNTQTNSNTLPDYVRWSTATLNVDYVPAICMTSENAAVTWSGSPQQYWSGTCGNVHILWIKPNTSITVSHNGTCNPANCYFLQTWTVTGPGITQYGAGSSCTFPAGNGTYTVKYASKCGTTQCHDCILYIKIDYVGNPLEPVKPPDTSPL